MTRFLSFTRRAILAAFTVVAMLATFVVAASPASAAGAYRSGAGNVMTVSTAGPGEQITADVYDDVFCPDGALNPPVTFYIGQQFIAGFSGANVGTFTFPAPTEGGTHELHAIIDAGECEGEVVGYGQLTVVASATTSTVTVADTPPYAGQPMTLEAAVAAVDSEDGTPTGSFTFLVNGSEVAYDVPVDGSGAASATWTFSDLGPHEVTAKFAGTGPFTASTATYTHTVPAEQILIDLFDATASADAGSAYGAWFSAHMTGFYNDIRNYDFSGLSATVDGDPLDLDVIVQSTSGNTASVNFNLHTAPLPYGNYTVELTAPAQGPFAAIAETVSLEVRARQVGALYATPLSAPVAADTPFEVTLSVFGMFGEPFNGTFNVYDGTVLVGTSGNLSGIGQMLDVAVIVSGLAAGPGQELNVGFVGSDHFEDAFTTVLVDVEGAPVNVDLTVDTDFVSGVPTDATITVSSDVGVPAGTVELFVDGVSAGTATVDSAGAATIEFRSPAGYAQLTAVFTSSDGKHQSGEAFYAAGWGRVDAEGTFNLSYAAPTSPDSTGTLSGDMCVTAMHPDFDESLFAGLQVDLSVVRDGVYVGIETMPLTDLGHCWGIDMSAADMTPGDYDLHAYFDGNDYVWGAAAWGNFTIAEAPTELALDIVGAPGDSLGLSTTFAAQLSAPVPGHTQSGTVTFYVNGDEVETVTVVDGAAQFTTSLGVGSSEVTASYSGDGVHAPATAGPVTLDVAQASATVDVSVSPNPPVAGEQATLRAAVTVAELAAASNVLSGGLLATGAAAAMAATGTVTFYVNGTPVGTAALVDGVAEFPYVFGPGAHTVSASYSGSADVAPVSAAASTEAVVTVAAPVPPTGPTPPAAPGSPLTLRQPTAPTAPGAPAPAPQGDAAPQAADAGRLPRTGSSTLAVVLLGAALLGAGVVLTGRRRS